MFSMGEQGKPACHDTVETTLGPPEVCTVIVRDYLTFAVAGEVLRRLELAVAGESAVRAVVLDLLGIDGFEPGVPARIFQWLGAQSGQIVAAVLVTSSRTLVATARAAEWLLPSTVVDAAPQRSEAIELAIGFVNRRARTSSAVRRRVATPLPIERKNSA
jgi:hypothetical protein